MPGHIFFFNAMTTYVHITYELRGLINLIIIKTHSTKSPSQKEVAYMCILWNATTTVNHLCICTYMAPP